MPKMAARLLANDDNLTTVEIVTIVDFLDEKLKRASQQRLPVPFITYRTKWIFEASLRLRYGQFQGGSGRDG